MCLILAMDAAECCLGESGPLQQTSRAFKRLAFVRFSSAGVSRFYAHVQYAGCPLVQNCICQESRPVRVLAGAEGAKGSEMQSADFP